MPKLGSKRYSVRDHLNTTHACHKILEVFHGEHGKYPLLVPSTLDIPLPTLYILYLVCKSRWHIIAFRRNFKWEVSFKFISGRCDHIHSSNLDQGTEHYRQTEARSSNKWIYPKILGIQVQSDRQGVTCLNHRLKWAGRSYMSNS